MRAALQTQKAKDETRRGDAGAAVNVNVGGHAKIRNTHRQALRHTQARTGNTSGRAYTHIMACIGVRAATHKAFSYWISRRQQQQQQRSRQQQHRQRQQ